MQQVGDQPVFWLQWKCCFWKGLMPTSVDQIKINDHLNLIFFLRRWHLSNFNTFWLLDLTSVSYCKGLDQSFELFCTASLDMHTFVLLAITITNKRHICNEECRLPGAAAGWAWPQPCTPSPVGEASLSCRPSPRWPVAAVGQAAQRS